MAVIVSNGSGNLTAANQFYKTAARNPTPTNGTLVNASTEKFITFTPDDTGHALGAIICLVSSGNLNRGFSVELQQYIGSTWTTVDSKVLTCTEIGNFTEVIRGEWIVPFTFTAGSVSLTAAASTWRLRLIQSGGTAGTWYLETSDGTNPFYMVWTDSTATFANGDCPVAKYPDVITFDANATLGPVFGTGAATRGIGAICTRSTSPTTTHETFNWTTSASITITCDGHFILSTHGGVKFGSSASPISIANQGKLYFSSPSGGGTYGGFRPCANAVASPGSYVEIYGEVPTIQRTTLASDAASGQAHIITTDDTTGVWSIGDTVYVGKRDASGITDVAARTISNISTTDITLSSNLSQKALAGASVVRTNGYGFILQGSTANTGQNIQQPNSLILSGVQIHQTYISGYTNLSSGIQETTATVKQYLVQDCSYIPQGTSSTANPFIANFGANLNGMLINRVNAIGGGIFYNSYYTPAVTGLLQVTNCVTIGGTTTTGAQVLFRNLYGGAIVLSDCKFENINSSQVAYLTGVGSTYKNNTFYGCSGGAYFVDGIINPVELSGDVCDRCGYYLLFYTISVGAVNNNPVLGAVTANTTDARFAAGAYVDYELASPTGNTIVTTTDLNNCATGSSFVITDYNDTANDDRIWRPEGYIRRTGYNLADTTVWNGSAFGAATAGLFGMRFEPLSSTVPLIYKDNKGVTNIGNCQGLTVTVTARVKINSATYYAGTHTNPTLRVTYDNGTQVTSVASDSTADQQLQVVFTPTTTTAFITIEVLGATDATSTDAQFYLGESVVAEPGGVLQDTTRLGSWSHGLPLGTFRTYPAPGSVWNEVASAFVVSGSFGDLINDLTSDTTTNIFNHIVESNGSYTLDQVLRVLFAIIAGRTENKGRTFKTPDGTTTRAVATINESARTRTSMVLTP